MVRRAALLLLLLGSAVVLIAGPEFLRGFQNVDYHELARSEPDHDELSFESRQSAAVESQVTFDSAEVRGHRVVAFVNVSVAEFTKHPDSALGNLECMIRYLVNGVV